MYVAHALTLAKKCCYIGRHRPCRKTDPVPTEYKFSPKNKPEKICSIKLNFETDSATGAGFTVDTHIFFKQRRLDRNRAHGEKPKSFTDARHVCHLHTSSSELIYILKFENPRSLYQNMIMCKVQYQQGTRSQTWNGEEQADSFTMETLNCLKEEKGVFKQTCSRLQSLQKAIRRFPKTNHGKVVFCKLTISRCNVFSF